MLLSNMLSTDYGIASLVVISVTLVIVVYFISFIKRKMDEDAKKTSN